MISSRFSPIPTFDSVTRPNDLEVVTEPKDGTNKREEHRHGHGIATCSPAPDMSDDLWVRHNAALCCPGATVQPILASHANTHFFSPERVIFDAIREVLPQSLVRIMIVLILIRFLCSETSNLVRRRGCRHRAVRARSRIPRLRHSACPRFADLIVRNAGGSCEKRPRLTFGSLPCR